MNVNPLSSFDLQQNKGILKWMLTKHNTPKSNHPYWFCDTRDMPLFRACYKHSQYAMFYRSRSIILQVSMLTRPSQQMVRAFQRRTARAAMSLSQKWIIMDNFNGGFLKWGYPNSWMVYKGRSQNKIDDLEVPAFEETSRYWNTKIQSLVRSVAVGSFRA